MSEAKPTPKPSSPTPRESSGLNLNEVVAGPTTQSAERLAITTTTEFVRKAVADHPSGDAAQLLLPKGAGPISAETLLAIVSYCYAKGIYSCRDIELAMLRNAELRESFGTHLPSDDCLRRFRRLNRSAIERILEETFIQAKRQWGCIPSDQEPTGATEPTKASQATSGSDAGQTTLLARQAAADRMEKALFIDGMSRDA